QVAFYQAQSLLGLPSVGTLVGLSDSFEPACIKAVEINPNNPLELTLLLARVMKSLMMMKSRQSIIN
ncbi:MAG: hypothetical protein KKF78_11170, partial [Candidatus Omnitrophica bacterium]|nr:hypothetical protein [Candidatus Omnitrophota bacterium]